MKPAARWLEFRNRLFSRGEIVVSLNLKAGTDYSLER
jgi:hypothetical protein